MPRDLLSLIKASGYAGVSGQSFRNNVAGATSGAKMSDYNLDGWTFIGAPNTVDQYGDGAVFDITISFIQSSRASNIKRLGNTIVATPGTQPEGFDIISSSSNVVAAADGSTVHVEVSAPTNGSITYSSHVWYSNYADGVYPPNDGSSQDVTFEGKVISGPPTGTDEVSLHLSYTPDIGGFNPGITAEFPFTMIRRSHSVNLDDYDWEWYSDSAYTNYVASGSIIVPMTAGQTVAYYLRASEKGKNIWNNVGMVSFTDNRPEA